MKLRPYQKRLVDAVVGDVRAGVPEVVLAAAPGAGKTEMAFAIIRAALAQGLAKRVLVLAHGTTVLRRQFAERALAEFGGRSVREWIPGTKHAGTEPVLVALPQSLHRRNDLPTCELVVVDEAHEYYDAKMAKKTVSGAGARSVVLLTGTPSRFVARGLPLRSIALYDVMKECSKAFANPAIDLASSEFPIGYANYRRDGEVKRNVRYGKRATRATLDGLLEKLVAHLPRRRGVEASGWKATITAMGKTIIACRSVALARKVVDYFRGREVNAGISTHQHDSGSAEIRRFVDDKNMPLLVVVRRGVLGFNFPELVSVVDMTGTINIDRIFQLFARVVRPHPRGPKVKKLFVKISPKGKMEAYTRDVMNAALQLGRKEVFESYTGRNLDGIPVPDRRHRASTEGGGEERKGRQARPRPLDGRFDLIDFFDTVEGLDREFSPYARTTILHARARAILTIVRRDGTCDFPGCDRQIGSLGLCTAHYAQRKAGKSLRRLTFPDRRRPSLRTACEHSDCGSTARSRGLCQPHYRNLLISMRRAKCSAPACKGTSLSKGLCGRHYQRKVRSDGNVKCSFAACQNSSVARSLCGGHYKLFRDGVPLRPLNSPRRKGYRI